MLPPVQEMGPRRRRGHREHRLTSRAAGIGCTPAAATPTNAPHSGERFVSSRSNTTLVSHFDCPGGGQVWVEGTTLFIGHMRWPSGTTIVDVADPRRPRQLATIDLPQGWHSHKVRAANGIMIVNHEQLGESGSAEFGGGIAIYDVSCPSTPKLITKWRTAGRGVHRYDFDGRYAYLSPTVEGYVGNIMMILDLADPARPVEAGRWWIPGQWKAGGEPYPWHDWPAPRCHHPLRMGNRLYALYRCGGLREILGVLGGAAAWAEPNGTPDG